MMTHSEAKKAIRDATDRGRMPIPEQVWRHVNHCDECRRALFSAIESGIQAGRLKTGQVAWERLPDLRQVVLPALEGPTPAPTQTPSLKHLLRFVAAAVALLAVALGMIAIVQSRLAAPPIARSHAVLPLALSASLTLEPDVARQYEDWSRPRQSLGSGTGSAPSVNLLTPVRTYVLETRPSFTWKVLKQAACYLLDLQTEEGSLTAKVLFLRRSGQWWAQVYGGSSQVSSYPVASNEQWNMADKASKLPALEPGQAYKWTVAGLSAPDPNANPGSSVSGDFRILSEPEAQKLDADLTRARTPFDRARDHADAGLFGLALTEFAKMPNDPSAVKFAAQIRKMRQGSR